MYMNACLIHALPPSERRCLNRKEAASYFGISPTSFDKLVQTGQVPRPIELLGRKVWDRNALDHALDARSGIAAQVSVETELNRELAEFRAAHGHG